MKTTILLILGVLAYGHTTAQCSSKGSINGTSFSDNNATGTFVWGSPSKAQESDDVYSMAAVNLTPFSGSSTHHLVATGFNFSIPAGAAVCGIEVQVERRYEIAGGSLSSITDNSVRLIMNGNLVGNNGSAGAAWSSSDVQNTYGNIWDSWGLFLTAADINSSTFGVAISAAISSGAFDLSLYAMVDEIKMTVYYNTILPVNFKDFRGVKEQDHVLLSWVTASESNSSHFVVEKTINDKWVAIDSLPAAINSSEDKSYHAIDKFPASINIYRIRQVDMDAHAIYSKSVKVHFSAGANIIIRSYPNPAQKLLTVESSASFQWAQLTDAIGKVALHKDMDTPAYSVILNIAQLPAGVYLLKTDKSGKEAAKRVVIYR